MKDSAVKVESYPNAYGTPVPVPDAGGFDMTAEIAPASAADVAPPSYEGVNWRRGYASSGTIRPAAVANSPVCYRACFLRRGAMRLVAIGAPGLRFVLLNSGTTRASMRALVALILAVALATAGAQTSTPDQAPSAPDQVPPAPAADKSLAEAWAAPEPWRTDRFFLETSVYTKHFHYDAAHDNNQNLILGEWNVTERWLVGAALFDNSFGQASQMIYGGGRFRPFDSLQQLYFKVAVGIVHGYHGQYRDKIPLNHSGFAPVIVPSMGYCINRFCSELVIFGTAGMLVTVGVTVP